MTATSAARLLAAGRVAIGAVLIVAPRVVTRGWIGAEGSAQPGAQALGRAVGVRDLLLGALALHTLGTPAGARMAATNALADCVDLGATLAARDRLPRSAVLGTAAVAGGSAVAGFALAAALRD